MTAQIIMMPGASAPPVEATAAVKSSSDVVAHLEDLLERARAGDIIDVAVVILSPAARALPSARAGRRRAVICSRCTPGRMSWPLGCLKILGQLMASSDVGMTWTLVHLATGRDRFCSGMSGCSRPQYTFLQRSRRTIAVNGRRCRAGRRWNSALRSAKMFGRALSATTNPFA